jgi:hypothetical protein
MTYYPTNPVSNTRQITFILEPWKSQTLYLLNEALISIKLKIVTKNGDALPKATELSTVNNILGSVFEDIKIYFNDNQVSVQTQCAHYKQYIESTLNFNKEVKDSWLQSQGYYADVYGEFETMGATNK